MFEPWPDEPEEPGPESRWGNPERDLPRIPEVQTKETDVDPHLFKTFWVSVVFANAALFGVSLGALLWYFRGEALLGGALVAAGVLAGLRTYASYRAFRNDERERSERASADGGGADANDDTHESAGECSDHGDVDTDDATTTGASTVDRFGDDAGSDRSER